MLKLYKRKSGTLCYAECWINGGTAVTHTGTVGERGETQEAACSDEARFVDEFNRHYTAQGYAQWPEQRMHWIVLQWPMDSMKETPYIRSVRNYGIKHLNEILGWTGLGHVDGFDMGRTSNPSEEYAMNLFCVVVDKKTAVRCILDQLPSQVDCHRLKIASRAPGEEDYRLDYIAKKARTGLLKRNEFYL